VLREISCEAGLVEASCRALSERGFINYYGLQRFGKGGAGNHLIGRALLQCDWKAAIDFMFTAKAGEREEVFRMKQHYSNGE
jgi:tRNA pseudouridine13 synthase